MDNKVCRPLGEEGLAPSRIPVEERKKHFLEVVVGFDKQQAQEESSRCLAAHPCSYCDVCELLCPDQCITRDPATGDIAMDLNHCKGCGLCAYFCPKGAIRMEMEKSE
jgi:Pyruvate/2-oxoacid:ferredoxin oxidoreductase delta subunit